MATTPINPSNVRVNLEYVFSRQEFWTLSVGHTSYLEMVRSNSILLAEYIYTLDTTAYVNWVFDCQAF